MKFLVKLFDTTQKASDDSLIPREQVEEYLQSEDYKNIIANRLSVGGVTHKDRRMDPTYGELIGPDDLTLVNDNITHYITKIFLKDNDNFAYAIAETFDPDLFSGARRDNIINVIGLLKSGVRPPISIVIQALWDTREVCKKIIRIKGFDITWSPAFEGAGVETVFEADNFKNLSKESEDRRVFSDSLLTGKYEGCRMITKTFSVNSVVQISNDKYFPNEVLMGGSNPSQVVTWFEDKKSNDKFYTRSEIIQKFGLNSEIAKKTRFMSEIPKGMVDEYEKNTLDNIDKVISSNGSSDKSSDIDRDESDDILDLLKEVTGVEDVESLKSRYHDSSQRLEKLISSVPKDDPNRRELLRSKLDQFFRNAPSTDTFSTVSSVKDRVLLENYPRFSMINRLVKSYKRYYETYGASLTDSEFELLKSLFINDLNLLIKKVQDKIYKGATLNSLFALSQFNDEIVRSGQRLSRIYRQVFIADKAAGFIPPVKYKEWHAALSDFYDEFCKYTFGVPYDQDITVIDKL